MYQVISFVLKSLCMFLQVHFLLMLSFPSFLESWLLFCTVLLAKDLFPYVLIRVSRLIFLSILIG